MKFDLDGFVVIGRVDSSINACLLAENLGSSDDGMPRYCGLIHKMNHFNGKLPSSRRLSELQFAFLDYNEVDTIPTGFFDGLTSIQILALNDNPFNATTGLRYLKGQ
uniref:Uncharacterized protein n=1 Tax=Vitis vinifera TaxID=29760 RepID=F6I3J8_VITVI